MFRGSHCRSRKVHVVPFVGVRTRGLATGGVVPRVPCHSYLDSQITSRPTALNGSRCRETRSGGTSVQLDKRGEGVGSVDRKCDLLDFHTRGSRGQGLSETYI